MVLQSTINPEVARIIREMVQCGLIPDQSALADMIGLTYGQISARTRTQASAVWKWDELDRLMSIPLAAGRLDFAGRILRLMHPGRSVCFRGEVTGRAADSDGDIMRDEALLTLAVGEFEIEVAEIISDGVVDDTELGRAEALANAADRRINSVIADLRTARESEAPNETD